MPGLNYPKAASRDAGRYGERYRPTGDGTPETTLEEVRRIVLGPDARRCRRCPDYFVTTGEEHRPLPLHLCPRCRLEVEEECEQKGLPAVLLDDTLTEALQKTAKLERRLVQAEQQGRSNRRLDYLRGRIERVRSELWAQAARYTNEEAAA